MSFQFESNLGHFINIPKAYFFEAVWQRELIDSKEFAESIISKRSVEIFEQIRTPNMKPTNPPTSLQSREVRILERSFNEACCSIRRTVNTPSWLKDIRDVSSSSCHSARSRSTVKKNPVRYFSNGQIQYPPVVCV